MTRAADACDQGVPVLVLSCACSIAAAHACHRLTSDPGIVAVMANHQFRVGRLAEMPPEVTYRPVVLGGGEGAELAIWAGCVHASSYSTGVLQRGEGSTEHAACEK
jgi:hypothetical protein